MLKGIAVTPRADDAWLEHDLAPGALLGERYVICDIVGEGGMGRVFRARHAVLARSVAVKLLRPALAKDPTFLRRFAAEARAASLVRHPGSVAIIDHGVCETSGPFLVMEYVGGSTLRSIVEAEGPLALRRVVGIVDQILAVLEDAHAAGIVHADMKSDNILVAATGAGADRVKVIDFGLARQRDDDAALAGSGDTISGTPEYLAPEVIRGRPPTAAADLYAVGIMLYELLTGGTPFAGGPAVRVLERHLRDSVVPPSLRRPDRLIPSALDRVVARALAKDPALRFPDAAAFRAALTDALLGFDLDAPFRCACGETRPAEAGACPMCSTAAERSDDAITHDLMPIDSARSRCARGSRPPR